MKYKRVIARLDIKNNALVKGIHLEGLRVMGDPREYATKYYNDQIDEIIYMDVVASLYQRNSLLDLVRETAKNIFIPLTVGGGIRTLEDVSLLLKSGADKVCINTAAVKSPYLIEKIANIYGSSTVVVAIETIKIDGEYMVFIDNGREYTGLRVFDWVKTVERMGAGEILLTNVDQEGTRKGFDVKLLNLVQDIVTIPLIAHGGLGTISDAENLFKQHDIDAICGASVFHYNAIHELGNSQNEIMGNKEFLRAQQFKNVGFSILELKNTLKERGVNVRL